MQNINKDVKKTSAQGPESALPLTEEPGPWLGSPHPLDELGCAEGEAQRCRRVCTTAHGHVCTRSSLPGKETQGRKGKQLTLGSRLAAGGARRPAP